MQPILKKVTWTTKALFPVEPMIMIYETKRHFIFFLPVAQLIIFLIFCWKYYHFATGTKQFLF